MGRFEDVDHATITAQNTADYGALRKRSDTIAIHYLGIATSCS